MRAGQLNKRVTFQTATETSDGGGGGSTSWGGNVTVWGQFRPERGRERLEAGRLESAEAGVLTVRSSEATRAITSAYRVLIDSIPFNIRAVSNPDQRNKAIEMVVEKGVAT